MESDVNTALLNTGSCGLHVLHGAFKKGADATGWRVDQFLSSAHWLLKDTPARREDYAKAVEETTPVMPLKYCKTRWVENVAVSERIVKILPDLRKYVAAVEAGKFKNPDTKSYHSVKEGCEDVWLPAKLAFHISYAKEVQDFLKNYQTDKPVLPFLADDLVSIFKSVMTRFIKPDIVAEATTITKLMKIDVADKKNHLHPSKIDLGFSADKLVKELVKQKKISERRELEYRIQAKECLVTLVQKLQDKSPLQYTLVRNLSCLDPRQLASGGQESCVKKVLQCLVDCKRIEESHCDEIVKQYRMYMNNTVTPRKGQFADFNILKDRLDTLYYETMARDRAVEKLWQMVRMLLLLSHGNASVERGFSINRQIEVENLQEKGYCAQRLICDHLQAVGGMKNVTYTKELLLSAAGARQRYNAYLAEQKQLKEGEAKANKRKF